MAELKCPHCGEELAHGDQLEFPRDQDFDGTQALCVSCGLRGPRDVLEALAARLAPAGVLDAAEKLLRGALVADVFLRDEPAQVYLNAHPQPGRDDSEGDTLADAYAKLKEARHDGG